MESTYLQKSKFKSAYFRELHRYSFENIAHMLGLNDKECKEVLKKLKYCGIIKVVKESPNEIKINELSDEEIIILGEDLQASGIFYTFKFVGVITINNCIIISYPKYIKSNDRPENEIKQILKVLKKYNADEQYINFFTGDVLEDKFNLLSVMLFIIDDFFNNGLYSNHKEVIEINGEGDILWDKIINESYAYLINDKPFYLELFTKGTIEDDSNYFNRLHKYILSECFKILSESNLNNLFEISGSNIVEDNIEDLGDKEYILYRIERELNIQYVTKKQVVLKNLYAYISQRKSNEVELGFSIYGTTTFNLVWEKVCAEVFDNKLNTKLRNLPLELSDKYKKLKNKTLLEIIEKPLWRTYENHNKTIDREASKTITPDLISISKINDKYGLAIFDAKYYCINFYKNKVYNQPGVGDVNKQYLYQLAYNDFIKSNGYTFFMNAFLLPSEEEDIVNVGQVEMSILFNIPNINMKNIDVVKLPAMKIFDLYINDRSMQLINIFNKLKNIRVKEIEESTNLQINDLVSFKNM